MQKLRAAVELVRLVLGRETLGEAPPPPQRGAAAASRGVLHVLFLSREPLGEEPVPPPREGKPFLRWIFGREALSFDPEPARPPRRGRLATLFAPEKLDDDSQ